MKRKFRKFQEGGEVDIPRRRPLRDQYGNIVRSGTGEPIMTAGEYSYEEYLLDNPQQVREDEAQAKQIAEEFRKRTSSVAPPPPPPPPPPLPKQPIVGKPLAPRTEPGPGDAAVAESMAATPDEAAIRAMMSGEDKKAAGFYAPKKSSAAASSSVVTPPVSPSKPPDKVSGGGRGVAAGKTAAQEMELLSRQKRLDPEKIKEMEQKQALQGVYPELLIPGLGRVFGRGAAAGKKPNVPSGGAAKPRNERTLADEVTQTGSTQLTRPVRQGALAQRGETAAGNVAERARDRGFVPGERRALEGKQPGQLQEAQQTAGRVEKYMGPAQEVRRELSKPPSKQLTKPATKEVPKPKKTRKEDDEAISRFEGESGAIRSGLRPGKKRFREDDDPMGRFGGESPSYMSKGGKVQKAPSPPDMGSSKYEPDLNKPKPKKKAMADDMDMFMARSGGLAKKIDGIALRGKTRGKIY